MTKDVMGFGRLEIAAIKRNYQNVKPLYRKAEKLQEKIKEEQKEADSLIEEARSCDSYTENLSKKVTGFSLTSKEVLDMHEDAVAWKKYQAEHGVENPMGICPDMQSPAPAQEPQKEVPENEQDNFNGDNAF